MIRRSDPPDRLNRTLLSILGLLLLGAGIYGLLRGGGAFGQDRAEDPLLLESVRDFVSDNAAWFWPLMAILALIVAYLAYRWLRAHIRSGPTLGHIHLQHDPSFGSTRVSASAAADALSAEIETYPGVRSASARLLTDGTQPEVELGVDLHDDANVEDVRRRIEEHAFPRFRQALDTRDLVARVRFDLAGPAGRLVR